MGAYLQLLGHRPHLDPNPIILYPHILSTQALAYPMGPINTRTFILTWVLNPLGPDFSSKCQEWYQIKRRNMKQTT